MYSEEKLVTIKNKDDINEVLPIKDILKKLNTAHVALRRINFLSKTFNSNNIYLKEVADISNNALMENKEL